MAACEWCFGSWWCEKVMEIISYAAKDYLAVRCVFVRLWLFVCRSEKTQLRILNSMILPLVLAFPSVLFILGRSFCYLCLNFNLFVIFSIRNSIVLLLLVIKIYFNFIWFHRDFQKLLPLFIVWGKNKKKNAWRTIIEQTNMHANITSLLIHMQNILKKIFFSNNDRKRNNLIRQNIK